MTGSILHAAGYHLGNQRTRLQEVHHAAKSNYAAKR